MTPGGAANGGLTGRRGAERPRLIFVNRYFHPDHSATAQILTDLCLHLAREGWRVSVVAGRGLYDRPDASLPARERFEGVEVWRVWTSGFGRNHLVGRAVDYVTFYLTAFGRLIPLCRRGDIVIAKTDPPLVSVVAGLAARLRGARLVNWLQDLYPEVGAELGVRALRGPVGRLLRALRNRSLRIAAANVAIGEIMAERIAREGARGVRVIHNWSDDQAICPLPHGQALRREWGFGEADFVVGYSGNLGRAHEVETLLAAARRLSGRPDVRFLFIGGGHGSQALKAAVEAQGLTSFHFQPYQPRERLGASLASADVHWLSLRPSLEGLIVPSKFYGVAAAGRPIIAVTDPKGELARLVEEHRCGVVVAPGEGQALAEALQRLAQDPALRTEMGENARRMLQERFSQAAALEHWRSFFDELSCGSGR